MLKSLIPVALCLFLGACSTKTAVNQTKPTATSIKSYPEYKAPLLSPIILQTDSTVVVIPDYFPLAEDWDIVSLPEGLKAHRHLDEFILKGEMANDYEIIRLKVNEEKYDLLVKNHHKIPYTFVYPNSQNLDNLQIKGSFNNWSTTANPLVLKEGIYTFSTWLSPGTYEYIMVHKGKEFLDPNNPNSKSNGMGGYNNVFTVGNAESAPASLLLEKPEMNSRNLNVVLENYNSISNTDPIIVLWENNKIAVETIENHNKGIVFSFEIPKEALRQSRSHLRVFANSNAGKCNDLLIPLNKGNVIMNAVDLNRKDFQSNVMYEVFVDRFYDGDPSNNGTLNSTELFRGTDWYGGDLQGMYQKMEEGYFSDLGVNCLWISPINLNPQGMYGHMTEYGIDTKFTGYHGYWPVSLAKIDPRFGNSETLQNIIKEAHQEDTNVLLDYVANHVHEEHPIVKNDMGWITPMYLPDGRKNNRLYDEQRLTTWFDDFMPTLDLERAEVTEVMTDSAVYWFKKYDIDGFRHDATKHIPNSFWRKLTYKLKTEVVIPQDRKLYQIGETYGNNALINSYINTGMLDAQFDFNLFDAAFNGVLNDNYPLTQTAAVLMGSLQTYGYHHLMGNISGNHDKGRSISYADGSLSFGENAKEAGYTRTISNQNGDLGFKKMAQFFAFNLFIPGIPVIYYGDEIGMPGGDDPDNRRMMQFDGLNEYQSYLKNTVSKLIKLRRSRMELLYGDTWVEEVGEDYMILKRSYAGMTSYLCVNTSWSSKKITLDLGSEPPSEMFLHFNHKGQKNGTTLSFTLEGKDFEWVTIN